MITTYRIKINVSSILQASCHPSGWWSEELRSGRCCGLGGGWVGEGGGGEKVGVTHAATIQPCVTEKLQTSL